MNDLEVNKNILDNEEKYFNALNSGLAPDTYLENNSPNKGAKNNNSFIYSPSQIHAKSRNNLPPVRRVNSNDIFSLDRNGINGNTEDL